MGPLTLTNYHFASTLVINNNITKINQHTKVLLERVTTW